jgi:hypothetical protein
MGRCLLTNNANRAYSSFLTKYIKYFVNIFSPKIFSKNKGNKSGWLMKGIKLSGQRLRLLRLLKKNIYLSSKTLNYIKKYQITYKVISEARKRENDQIISKSINHTKAFPAAT